VPGIPGCERKFYARLRRDIVAAAELEFRLAVRDEDGISYRTILEGLESRTGKRHKDLDPPPIPPAGAYLLEHFGSLSAGRGSSGFGPLPLSATEILSWSKLSRRRLNAWEFSVIRDLDAVWMTVTFEGKAKK
jgi:hypothetical protein